MANSNKIEVSELTNEIVKSLQTYTTEIEKKVETYKSEAAADLVKHLRRTSPKRFGAYSKGWVRVRQGKGWIVRNRVYQLTHLLENGHAKRNGGRVRAQPHIKPGEDRMIETYVQKIERAISNES